MNGRQKEFRDAMAELPAAVNVLTTNGPHGPAGVTVSAVCAVTDSPPTILVCLQRASNAHRVFTGSEHVCVNVLGAEHDALALCFAGSTGVPMTDRFRAGDWDLDVPAPVLHKSLISLLGRISGRAVQGSHTVFFIEIDNVLARTDKTGGLVYFQRRFHPVPTRSTR